MAIIYYPKRLFPQSNLKHLDQKIIENIIERITNNKSYDMKTIAELNFRSQPTISRIARRAGFNNYKELIFFLKTRFVNNTEYHRHFENLPFVSTKQSWDEIDYYFKKSFSSKKIYLFGEGFCQFLVGYAYRKLLLKKIYPIDLQGVEISSVSDDTPYTLLTFSISGENKHGLIKIDECKKMGGNIIAFTSTKNSHYDKLSDVSFLVDRQTKEFDYENKNINFFFGNTLNLIEYLIYRYTNGSS